VPTGTIKFERVVDGGPQFMAGFFPSPSASSSGTVQYQSKDGWWFIDEAQAQNASQIYTTGAPEPSTSDPGDESWIGKIAHEDPNLAQKPIFDLPKAALTFWGMDPWDGTLRPACKPPVSRKGLMPMPPDKRRSGIALGLALDCCRSLERNAPDTMKPAIGLVAATLPKESLVACLGGSPEKSRGGAQPLSPMSEAQSRPLISNSAYARQPTPDIEMGLNRQTSPSLRNAAATPAADKQMRAPEAWTQSDMDVTVEAMHHKNIGLPVPSQSSLAKWYRTAKRLTTAEQPS